MEGQKVSFIKPKPNEYKNQGIQTQKASKKGKMQTSNPI